MSILTQPDIRLVPTYLEEVMSNEVIQYTDLGQFLLRVYKMKNPKGGDSLYLFAVVEYNNIPVQIHAIVMGNADKTMFSPEIGPEFVEMCSNYVIREFENYLYGYISEWVVMRLLGRSHMNATTALRTTMYEHRQLVIALQTNLEHRESAQAWQALINHQQGLNKFWAQKKPVNDDELPDGMPDEAVGKLSAFEEYINQGDSDAN